MSFPGSKTLATKFFSLKKIFPNFFLVCWVKVVWLQLMPIDPQFPRRGILVDNYTELHEDRVAFGWFFLDSKFSTSSTRSGNWWELSENKGPLVVLGEFYPG